MNNRLQFELSPKRIAMVLGATALLLVLLNIASAYLWTDDGLDIVSYQYLNMFDLDEEESFGTWFAVVILLIAGLLTLIVAHDSRRSKDGLWIWWLVLGLGFHYLSVDEVAGIHEFLNTHGDDLFGIDTAWTTYALVAVGLLAVAYLPFLFALFQRGQRRTLLLLVVSGALYVGGAVGVELLSPSDSAQFNLMAYNMGWISVEEGLEMAGIILVIYTLLDYVRGGKTNTLQAQVESEACSAASI